MPSISILCSDERHPIRPYLTRWAREHAHVAEIRIIDRSVDANGGDILFLVSCHEIIGAPLRERYRNVLVLHASDLPNGKGMSPHVWQVLEGATEIVVTLLEAANALDAGDIWHQARVEIPPTALHDEIHDRLFEAELALMSWALDNHASVKPRPQLGVSSYYCRRTPQDSCIDPQTTLQQAFNQLRIADPDRYPAFFEHLGVKFKIRIERM